MVSSVLVWCRIFHTIHKNGHKLTFITKKWLKSIKQTGVRSYGCLGSNRLVAQVAAADDEAMRSEMEVDVLDGGEAADAFEFEVGSRKAFFVVSLQAYVCACACIYTYM